MGKLADVYDRISVTAKSPDRTVSITATGRGQVRVELAPDVARVHTDESLQRQLNATVRVAAAALKQAMSRAYQVAFPESAQPS
ncbi:YbaB/EbfC family nucleoid-associated protein [Rhizomonospora bruguierae]|uniref:YbaB/EbfC family nucleoid-associated protein n=1 Tax=Rhizomonospora bruguierae TaxID=1581705 RepID=UPI001BD02AD8|nr:YbaB/EbfC family nucleoid-associated protein [Micromonospora sp. NBRC 107566]